MRNPDHSGCPRGFARFFGFWLLLFIPLHATHALAQDRQENNARNERADEDEDNENREERREKARQTLKTLAEIARRIREKRRENERERPPAEADEDEDEAKKRQKERVRSALKGEIAKVKRVNADRILSSGPRAEAERRQKNVVQAIMSIEGRLDRALWSQLSRLGIVLEDYLGGRQYLVSIRELDESEENGTFAKASEISGAEFALVGDRPAAIKVSSRIKRFQRSRRIRGRVLSGPDPAAEDLLTSFTVTIVNGVSQEVATGELNALDFKVVEQIDQYTYVIKPKEDVDGDEALAELQRLARSTIVKTLDLAPPIFHPLMDRVRTRTHVDQVVQFAMNPEAPLPAYGGLTGRNIRVMVADSGVNACHVDFNTPTEQLVLAGVSDLESDCAIPENPDGPIRVTSFGADFWSAALEYRDESHGTHVASIIGGSGFASPEANQPAYGLRGIAPGVVMGDYPGLFMPDTAALTGEDFDAQYQINVLNVMRHGLLEAKVDVSNHSYAQSELLIYDSVAAALDRMIRGDTKSDGDPLSDAPRLPPRPQVWSAGNNGLKPAGFLVSLHNFNAVAGYYSVFCTAKNAICVGALDTSDAGLYSDTSLGPTPDGRIKPDIVAPGCFDSINGDENDWGVRAASSQGNGYAQKCGTSMAAPAVTGIIALMLEKHRSVSPEVDDPLPATLKAMLVQSADDLVKTAPDPVEDFNSPDTNVPVQYGAGPDYATGFGAVNAEDAVALIGDRQRWQEDKVEATGDSKFYCMAVPPGAAEVKVALAWDDAPGSGISVSQAGEEGTPDAEEVDFTADVLQNDLDLTLYDPTADRNQLLPWTLTPPDFEKDPLSGSLAGESDPGPSRLKLEDFPPAKPGRDRLNNVEMASLANPASGEWVVRVDAWEIRKAQVEGMPDEQRFSLAASHPLTPCDPGALPDAESDEDADRSGRTLAGRSSLISGGDASLRPESAICRLYPDLCTQFASVPEAGTGEGRLDWRQPQSLDDVCRRTANLCPSCNDGLCRSWRLRIRRMPPRGRAVLFDGAGTIITDAGVSSRTSTVRIPGRLETDPRYLVILNRSGAPLSQAFDPRFDRAN